MFPYRITKSLVRRVTCLLLMMALSVFFLPSASSQNTPTTMTMSSWLDSETFSLKGQSGNTCGTSYYYYYDSFYVGENIHGSISASSPIAFYLMTSADWTQDGAGAWSRGCNPTAFRLTLPSITSHSFDYTITSSGRYYLVFWNTGTTAASISYSLYSYSVQS